MTEQPDVALPSEKRSRRALLAGGLGGLGAWLASAVTRPQPALAATDTAAVHKGVNNPTSAATTITCSGATAIRAFSNSGPADRSGVYAQASGTNSRGVTGVGVFGVLGQSGATGGRGLHGLATATSGNPVGVNGRASAPGGRGVQGENHATSGLAVGTSGTSKSSFGIGVLGSNIVSAATDSYGVYGEAYRTGVGGDHLGTGAGSGVLGTSASPQGIAVKAVNNATQGDAFGVRAETDSPAGTAIRAVHNPTSGTGGAFVAVTNAPNGFGIQVFANNGTAIDASVDAAGTALDATGQVKFSSAGVATVAAGTFQKDVTPGVPIPVGAKILCTANSSGSQGVLYAERLSSSQFRITLTGTTAQACDVAYFVIG